DREGEAISWHLSNVLNIKEPKSRIVFNEISKKAVLKALENCREINMQLVDAQQARRVLDRLVGYELSPIISRKIKSGLSAGRVQSVALKMIVDKEREIRNFKPEEYWNIFAQVTTENNLKAKFKSEFNDIDGKKTKVKNKETADTVIDGSKKGVWSVDKIKRAESISRPNPPFTTSTMQQDAISKLGMSASMVTQIAQKLYEGVEVAGEGQVALVTYIRTDSVRVSLEAQNEALDYIKSAYGDEYAPKKPNFYSSKKDAQDAHEAIRPIAIDKTPDSLKDKIGRSEYRLYKLIYDRFVASQMSPAVFDTLTVHIVSEVDNKTKYGYVLKGKTVVFKGFTAVYNNAPVGEEDDEKLDKALPNFEENQLIKMIDVSGEQKFTKPPTRYTDGSFIKAMEDNGIGRPSTFEKTITTITKRNYVDREGKSLFPTELGEIVCDQLIKYFPDIMDVKFTSTMEANLDKIEEGGIKWTQVIADFYPSFHKKVEEVKYDGVRIKPKDEV
ncbi:MAG: type I DNA topoisomerase, partial [Clostridia bacterium]